MTDEATAKVVQIGVARAERSGDAQDWTPRDTLVEMLRMIDAGEVEVTTLVICHSGPGARNIGFQNCSADITHALGLLTFCSNDLQRRCY